MTTKKVIPISQARPDTPDAIDALHDRLEGAGYLRLMQIGEPRLSELVMKYKGRGYEVEVVPFVDDGDDGSDAPPSGGCGPGSCSAGGSASGCASSGCGSGASPTNQSATASPRGARTRTVVSDVGTIYVRMKNSQVSG